MDDDFKEIVRNHISHCLPGAYLETSMDYDSAARSAIVIPHGPADPGRRIYLDELQDCARETGCVEAAIRAIASARAYKDTAGVPAYDTVRRTLSTRLCDIECSADYLADKPWTPYGPFALYYRIQSSVDDPGSTRVVTNQMLEAWHIDTRELHQDAIAAESRVTYTYDPDEAADEFFAACDPVHCSHDPRPLRR